MFITNLKRCLPYLAEANIPALIWGVHGIGKSQGVRQWCEELGYWFGDLRLGTQEVGDLLGLADFVVDPVTGQKIATKFMTPNWLKECIDFANANPDKKAVIFLDEFNRARRDVLQASFQLVLDKQLHEVKLPKNVYILAASNPNTEDYIVTDVDDKALMDRFCHIKLSPSVDEWLKHAENRNFSSDITEFIRDQKQLLQAASVDFQLDFVKPSRRSWEMVNKLIAVKTPDVELQELCFGLVGVTATSAFIEHRKNSDKPLTAEEVIKSYSKHRKKFKESTNDKTGGRFDLVTSTMDKVQTYLEKRNQTNEIFTDKEEKNLMDFSNDIPDDFLLGFFKNIYRYKICRNSIDNNQALLDRLAAARKKAGIGIQETK